MKKLFDLDFTRRFFLLSGSDTKQSGMRGPSFLLPHSVIIKRKGFSAPVWRAIQRIGVTVKRSGCRGENNHPVKNGQNLFNTLLHFRIPKLNVTTKLFLPVFIQIKQKVQPAIQIIFLMLVKIDMNPQLSTPGNFM